MTKPTNQPTHFRRSKTASGRTEADRVEKPTMSVGSVEQCEWLRASRAQGLTGLCVSPAQLPRAQTHTRHTSTVAPPLTCKQHGHVFMCTCQAHSTWQGGVGGGCCCCRRWCCSCGPGVAGVELTAASPGQVLVVLLVVVMVQLRLAEGWPACTLPLLPRGCRACWAPPPPLLPLPLLSILLHMAQAMGVRCVPHAMPTPAP